MERRRKKKKKKKKKKEGDLEKGRRERGRDRKRERGGGKRGEKGNLVDVTNVDLHAGVVLGGDQRIGGRATMEKQQQKQ